jgi:hypothetical protein
MWTKTVLLLLTIAPGMACSHQAAETRETRRPQTVESRTDWHKLGERRVDGANDRDVITVGAREGSYRRIMIVVEDSALEMYDVVVTFGDGTRFSPSTRHVYGPNSRSRVIDLPGASRIIRSVEFRYGNLPGGGRAQAELWAQ